MAYGKVAALNESNHDNGGGNVWFKLIILILIKMIINYN